MSSKVTSRLVGLLRAAEERDRCLAPANHADYKALRRRVGHGVANPYPGMFVRERYWDRLDARGRALAIMRALSDRYPGWVFCGTSAAVAHGLWVSDHRLDTVHVFGRSYSESHFGAPIRHHAAPVSVQREGAVTAAGVPVTTLTRTAAACMGRLPFPEGLAIADSLVRDHYDVAIALREQLAYELDLTPPEDIPEVAEALRALAHANPLSSNGFESAARGLMIENGFVEPMLKLELPDVEGVRGDRRFDFAWVLPSGKVVLAELEHLQVAPSVWIEHRMGGKRPIVEKRPQWGTMAMGCEVVHLARWMIDRPEELVRTLDGHGVPHAA